ncbi:MAG TPA: hypothetical protein VKX49_13350 [Bryobacteraceae bacterium]|nr:hypothetical protein [Bryobacteraceae bacterium]
MESRTGWIALAVLAVPLFMQTAGAQTRFTYSKGQPLAPTYEGWMPNDDGSFTMYFGYINTNWEQQFDLPIGPDNQFEPGPADQGQPTHFYPRRNPFLFTVRVPKDFGTKEITWTLRANGKTEKAFASLKSDYQIDKQVISTEVGGDFGSLRDELRYNIPPELEVAGETQRTVKVGEAMSLVALAGDPDNLPPRRDGKPQPRHAGKAIEEADKNASEKATNRQVALTAQASRPPVALVVESGPGLRLSWIVYRGKASAVTFDPEQMKTWTDSRTWANSPWSPPYVIPDPPPDGKWTTKITFHEPGEYVLRAVASDGSLFTYQNVNVTVVP